MKKIVYAKYSNDRNVNYRIRTDILEDEQGKRYVQKHNTEEQGRGHIENMYQNFPKLQEQFANTKFTMNQFTKIEHGIEFEFLKGETLENELDHKMYHKDFQGLLTLIKEFDTELRKAATLDFVPTSQFEKIFGIWELKCPMKSMAVSDVDMIFSNIIQKNEKWEVIDYEWTYNFPIPVDWIIYRAVYGYLAGQRESIIKEHYDLLRELQISVEEAKYFKKMEDNFQEFLVGDSQPLWRIYHDIRGVLYFPNGEIEHNKWKTYSHQIEVTKQFEDGHLENYYINPIENETGQVSVEVYLEPKLKLVRLDPAQCCCYVQIKSIVGEGLNCYIPSYGTNGFTLDNKGICFTTDDPQIWIGDIQPNARKIVAMWQIEYPQKEYLLHQAMIIEQVKKERAELLQEKSENSHAQQCMEERERYKNLYEKLMNSRSWKLTKPFREIARILKWK
ncbi:MAG: hypothetical protein RR139_01190 [Lachnospiraceae bacterium]